MWDLYPAFCSGKAVLSRDSTDKHTDRELLISFFFFFSSTSLLLPTRDPPPSCTHAQSCNPMDCSLPGSSVHGLFQARILEWVAISFSTYFFFNKRIRLRCYLATGTNSFFIFKPSEKKKDKICHHHICLE